MYPYIHIDTNIQKPSQHFYVVYFKRQRYDVFLKHFLRRIMYFFNQGTMFVREEKNQLRSLSDRTAGHNVFQTFWGHLTVHRHVHEVAVYGTQPSKYTVQKSSQKTCTVNCILINP